MLCSSESFAEFDVADGDYAPHSDGSLWKLPDALLENLTKMRAMTVCLIQVTFTYYCVSHEKDKMLRICCNHP